MGKTALHYCAENGHALVAEELIRAGAHVSAVDSVSKCIEWIKVWMLSIYACRHRYVHTYIYTYVYVYIFIYMYKHLYLMYSKL